MGVVYRGTQVALKRTVALKVVRDDLANDPEFRERFTQESEIAASLDHPHVVPVYAAGEDAGHLYVVMRFVEGTDLRAALRARGRLDPAAAAGVVAQVGAALDAAHRRGLVHRDVKPANILLAEVDGRPHAYLTDFGLSRHLDAVGLTRAGTVVGTPDYLAPEQLGGSGPVDGRVDVYALGCVLHQALTGQVPFPRDSDHARLWAHMTEPPPRPGAVVPELPPGFDEVVARALAKQPDDRYATAGELGRAALAAAQEAPGGPSPEAARPTAPMPAWTAAPGAPGYSAAAPGGPGHSAAAPVGGPGYGTRPGGGPDPYGFAGFGPAGLPSHPSSPCRCPHGAATAGSSPSCWAWPYCSPPSPER
jgi:serine/threonine protein kinase